MKVLGYGNVKGIDLDYWKRTAAQDRTGSSFTFIFVGRIVKDKGMNELVSAFVKLHQQFPNCHLLLVGPYEQGLDPVLPETKRLIDECDAIETVGLQKDVRPFYEKSDVLVFPSYREGFPNTPIEAGAMGLPCIVTDINGSREIITDGENGIVVPPRNTNKLYEAMSRIVLDKEKREAMAANARPMVAKRFEQSFVRKCLYDFYEMLLDKSDKMAS
jgi:glycosyltransferase involved in cell wall biosynthesis